MSGSREPPVPDASTQVAVPAAPIVPRQTWAVPNPETATKIVPGAPGRAPMSQIYRDGNGAAWMAVAVQLPPERTSRNTLPSVVPA